MGKPLKMREIERFLTTRNLKNSFQRKLKNIKKRMDLNRKIVVFTKIINRNIEGVTNSTVKMSPNNEISRFSRKKCPKKTLPFKENSKDFFYIKTVNFRKNTFQIE